MLKKKPQVYLAEICLLFSDTLFIGRELRSTATLSPCGPGKHDIILDLTRMGLQPREGWES